MKDIPSCYRFIKLSGGEDGAYYVLVHASKAKEYIEKMADEGYTGKIMNRKNVPPCRYMDHSITFNFYTDGYWKNGENFYFKEN